MEQWSQAWHWRQSSDEYASRVIDEEGAVTDSSPCLKRAPSRDGRQEAELSYTQCKLQAGFDGGPGGRLTEPREAPGPPFYSARGSLETPMANPPPPDPTSHRVIEKRRRDRMNNCLVNLSHLVPSCHQRKGRGRIEKTEIIEHAIKHIRDLQEQLARLPGTMFHRAKQSVGHSLPINSSLFAWRSPCGAGAASTGVPWPAQHLHFGVTAALDRWVTAGFQPPRKTTLCLDRSLWLAVCVSYILLCVCVAILQACAWIPAMGLRSDGVHEKRTT
ncbi:Transcription factor cwo [Amphibalanus amphitrite]|uniref:Transcription factor cwo n=1 Tax=Amphibalanus amphitrite TaxID=1232801 RepID=A0A6A4WQ73_AMPAM|nr:Transcription factor cwo [Amphibalanus amphitrite]